MGIGCQSSEGRGRVQTRAALCQYCPAARGDRSPSVQRAAFMTGHLNKNFRCRDSSEVTFKKVPEVNGTDKILHNASLLLHLCIIFYLPRVQLY